MKIVINRCYGGFGVSEALIRRVAEERGLTLYPDSRHGGLLTTWWTVPPDDPNRVFSEKAQSAAVWPGLSRVEKLQVNTFYSDFTIPTGSSWDRTDPLLVKLVEELGTKADGPHAELEVVEIPDGVEWEISEYDGIETIHEKHRSW